MKRLVLLAFAGALLAAACSDTPQVNLGGNYRVALSMPPVENHDIDVLFVIDNSASMLDNQRDVATRSQAALFDVIDHAIGGPPNLHVGVITSSMGAGGFSVPGCPDGGDGGRLLTTPVPGPCSAPTTDHFLSDVAVPGGGREQNFSGTLADAFGCIVQRGGDGCGFEQPLAALERAVSGDVAENVGFLRPEALLVVIFITDEDDCSSPDGLLFDPNDQTLGPFSGFRCFQHTVICEPDDPATPGSKTGCVSRDGAPHALDLQHTVDALVAAKGGEPGLVMVATIAGALEPVVVSSDENNGNPRLDVSCRDGNGDGASPPIRLFELLRKFPGRSWFESVCGDVEPALRRTASAVGDIAGRRPCLRGSFRDLDAQTAGVQPSCRAFAVDKPFTTAEVRHELKACDAAGPDQPCFSVAADASQCSQDGAPGLRADIAAHGPGLDGKHVVVECLAP